jgi:putative transposase
LVALLRRESDSDSGQTDRNLSDVVPEIAWPIVMPRKPRQQTSDFPYNISARCINKEWFRLPMPLVWEVFERHLFALHSFFGFRVIQFVLMNNHFHMIVATPLANLSDGMLYFMRETSREITEFSGRINQTYGGPFHSTVISTNEGLSAIYRYNYRNPVEAKICSRVELYPYSTLQSLLGQRRSLIPVMDDPFLFERTESTLQWLNDPLEKDESERIRKALRKAIFQTPVHRATRRLVRLRTID